MFSESFNTFSAWGVSHVLILLIAVALVIFASVYKWQDVKNWRIISRCVCVAMICLEFVFLFWNQFRFGFSVKLLPFELCTISMYLTAFVLWTDSTKIFKVTFFWSLTGGTIAFIIPMQNYEFPHFRYIHYFFNHLMLLAANIAYFRRHKIKLTYKDVLITSAILFVTAFILLPINLKIGTNFMFIAQSGLLGIPISSRPLWIILLILFIFAVFNLIYILSKKFLTIADSPASDFETRASRKKKNRQGK